MNYKLAILLLCVLITGVLCRKKAQRFNLTFDDYKGKFNRRFKSNTDNEKHRQRFAKHIDRINAHNSQNKSYTMTVNFLTDIPEEEVKGLLGLSVNKTQLNAGLSYQSNGKIGSPPVVDWRESGKVSPIKYQGSCGACWAFSIAAISESHLAIKQNTIYDLSEEALLECTTGGSCSGGYFTNAFNLLTSKGGLPQQADFPYKATDQSSGTPYSAGICSASVVPVATKYTQYSNLKPSQMRELLAVEPVAAAILAEDDFLLYESGVYYCTTPNASSQLNHGITVVGYTADGDYIIKNSWSTDWGEQGFGYISGQPGSDCGITTTVFQLSSYGSSLFFSVGFFLILSTLFMFN